jgi:CheY-like chemotaxis protein
MAGPHRRVLVVDDDADSADSMAMILLTLGHEFRTAYNGPGALEIAESFQPDAVLLDIGLPGLDGYEVARRMRRDERLKNVLLIAVTGYGRSTDFALSWDVGFDAHFVKPVDPVKIQQILTALAPSASR